MSNQNKKCQFFPSCGGCVALDLNQDEYRKIKSQNLQKILPFYQKEINFFWIKENSRRKIILQIDKKNQIGFFKKSSNDLIDIDKCYVCEDELSNFILPIKNFVKKFEHGFFTKIQLTLFDNVLEAVFFIKKNPEFSHIQKITQFAKEAKINALYNFENEFTPIFIEKNNFIKLSNGIILELDSKEIFIQATTGGLNKITQIINDFIKNNFQENPQTADIYAGFGAYSFAISKNAKSIMAFEGSQKMCDLINKNATKNALQSKIKTKNRDLFFDPIQAKELQNFDLIIINPPRNGATPQIKEIAKSQVENLIYVSCNPKTFAFDAKILLENGYKIEKIEAIDQFFGSNHLEIVAIFNIETRAA